MYTKLTLRIEEPLIKAAKRYSKEHGKSLSQLVADYLLCVTGAQSSQLEMDDFKELPPLTRSLKGILRGKKITKKDYKKYLKDKFQ